MSQSAALHVWTDVWKPIKDVPSQGNNEDRGRFDVRSDDLNVSENRNSLH